MKMNEAIPSNYLKSADAEDGDLTYTVDEAVMEEIKERSGVSKQKLVVSFRETEKKLILNVTNAKAMFRACGDDTEDWGGKKVRITQTFTDLAGEQVPCLRVDPRPFKAKGQAEAAAAPAAPARAAPAPAPAQAAPARLRPYTAPVVEDDESYIPF